MEKNKKTPKNGDVKQETKVSPKREKTLCIINIAVLMTIFTGITLFMTFGQRPNVSYEENRNLEKMPEFSWESYWSGDFTEQFGRYYNDTVPMRSTWKQFISQFRSHIGIKYDGGVTIIGQLPVTNNTSKPADTESKPANSIPAIVKPSGNSVPAVVIPNTSSSADGNSSTESPAESNVPEQSSSNSSQTTSQTPVQKPADVDGEIAGGIMVLSNGRGLMLYGTGYEAGRNYADTVNQYKEQLPDVNVYSMVAPTAVSFYMPEKYAEATDSETAHINDINEHLNGIVPIDVYSALQSHTDEEIYYRTDHHWSQLGAWYAAREFAKAAQVPFDELAEYDRYEKSGYIGTLYGSSNQNQLIKDNPETFVYYIPKREFSTTYYDTYAKNGFNGSYFFNPDNFGSTAEWNLTYMCGNDHIVHVNTNQKNGRKLMIIKDSYADSLAPCLFGSFEDIWIVDMRYCDTSAIQLAKDNGITDLLFCSCTFSATAQNQYKLKEIM